jgi:DhnA family fructose-bisphosphate aldolase class Ia
MEQARDAGAIGCSVGRNVFQHQNPEAITAAISRVFRDKWLAKKALQELESKLRQPRKT